jgi:hypothetical protein
MMLLLVLLLACAHAASTFAQCKPFALKAASNRASCRIALPTLPPVLSAAPVAVSLSAAVQDRDRANPAFEIQVRSIDTQMQQI